VNDTLLEQYRRNPVALRLKLEAAARRERARYIQCFLQRSAEALFRALHSRLAAPTRPFTPHAPCTDA